MAVRAVAALASLRDFAEFGGGGGAWERALRDAATDVVVRWRAEREEGRRAGDGGAAGSLAARALRAVAPRRRAGADTVVEVARMCLGET